MHDVADRREVPHLSYAVHLLKKISCSKVRGTFQASFPLPSALCCPFVSFVLKTTRTTVLGLEAAASTEAASALSRGPLSQGPVLGSPCFSQGFAGLGSGDPVVPASLFVSVTPAVGSIFSCAHTASRNCFHEPRT